MIAITPNQQQHMNKKSPLQCPPRSTGQLGTTSLLAPAYVPLDLRRVNCQGVASVIKAKERPRLLPHIQKVYESSVITNHHCACRVSHEQRPPWNRIQKVPFEPHFALGSEGKNRASPTFAKVFKSIDKVHGRNDYINTTRNLLREEHEETLVLYERYSQYNCIVKVTSGPTTRGLVNAHGIFNAQPPLKSGDIVLLRPQRAVRISSTKRRAPVEWVEIQAKVVQTIRGKGKAQDKVLFTWLNPVHTALLANERFTVRFLPSTIEYERSLSALDWINTLHPDAAKNLLFPTEAPQLPSYSPIKDELTKDLNEKQSSFVKMVLTRTVYPSMQKVRPPLILTGPAGTGKTRALLVSILKTLQLEENHKKRILVCTPSHASADVIARRLGKYLSSKQLFRLFDSSRLVETVPVDMLPFTKQDLNGEFILPTASELMGFQVIVCTCSDANILYLAGITNNSLRTRRNCLKDYILHSVQANNLVMTGKVCGDTDTHFTHLFIDEAAQATEPETLIPLSVVVDDVPGSVKVEVVLAGDPKQLTPNIFSPWAMEGLQKSLLERLLRLPIDHLGGGRPHLLGPPTKDTWTSMDELIEYAFHEKEEQQHLSVFLTTSYRGHPSLLLMPSKLFYYDKLRSAHLGSWKDDDKWCPILRKIEAMSTIVESGNKKQSSWPMHFRAVVGLDKSTAVESCFGVSSWSNNEEAIEVSKIVVQLVQEGVNTQSIGIMAPFRAQVVLIRRLLREQNLGMVNVGMVEDYQAVEREVIILSLTRSTEDFLESDFKRRVGLFNQPKRTNVALTRAENLLVVVGSPLIMEKDKIWRDWLLFCHENGLCYGDDVNAQRTMKQN